MKVKPKSCSCKACKEVRRKSHSAKRTQRYLQKRFRQEVKRASQLAAQDPDGIYEPNQLVLAHIWS